MSRFMRMLAASILLAAGMTAPFQRASACSVCMAGDPVYSSNGTSGPGVGDVSIYLEGKAWTKKSGVLPSEQAELDFPAKEKNQSERLDLYLAWTPIDRLTLSVDLPWGFNEITTTAGPEKHTQRLEGFGDLITQVSGVLWRNRDVLPTTWVEGRAFVKFPTGESDRTVDGEADAHLQVGTGSYDWGLGAALVHRFEWASLYASTSYRFNREGSLDYQYGDVLLANTAVAVPLGHATGVGWLERFTPGLELNFRWSDYDQAEHMRYPDSGGSILYVTPSLRVALPWWTARPPALRAAVQIPTTSTWLHGFQKEDPIWMLGLNYTF